MTEWRSGFTTTGIHYTRTGGDRPPLVLAHGFTDSGLCWTRAAQALEDTYDVVMPDARGHGLTPLPDQPQRAESLADDLSGLIRELGLGKPPIVGHSMGAVTALATATGHPDRVGAIVLVDPPWRLEADEQRPPGFWAGWRNSIAADKQKTDQELTARVREEGPTWHETEIRTKVDAIRQLDIRVFDLFTLPLLTWRELLPGIGCPALLVWADAGGIPEGLADIAAGLTPNLATTRIDNSGHCIQRDQFERFVDTVQQFLNGL
ncbi:MAG: alpha/beta fold hydrolase [Spirochaetota bacterium]